MAIVLAGEKDFVDNPFHMEAKFSYAFSFDGLGRGGGEPIRTAGRHYAQRRSPGGKQVPKQD